MTWPCMCDGREQDAKRVLNARHKLVEKLKLSYFMLCRNICLEIMGICSLDILPNYLLNWIKWYNKPRSNYLKTYLIIFFLRLLFNKMAETKAPNSDNSLVPTYFRIPPSQNQIKIKQNILSVSVVCTAHSIK